MKKMISTFILLMVLINQSWLMSCKKSIEKGNLIQNPSFEFDGISSLQHWTENSLASFSNDTPPKGGGWSVQLKPGNTQGSVVISTINTYVTGQSGTNKYALNVWIKSVNDWSGSIGIGLWSKGKYNSIKTANSSSDKWEELSLEQSLTTQETDSIVVMLSAGIGSAGFMGSGGKSVLFDRVKLKIK